MAYASSDSTYTNAAGDDPEISLWGRGVRKRGEGGGRGFTYRIFEFDCNRKGGGLVKR
jgi:hypothetical protein